MQRSFQHQVNEARAKLAALRLEREYKALMQSVMSPKRDVPAFKRSGMVQL